MSTPPGVRVRGLRARAIELELRQPLETASGSFARWPMVLLDLQTADGVVGHSFINCFLPMMARPLALMLEGFGPMVAGAALSPVDIDRNLRSAVRLIGVQGPLAAAIAMVEIAAWDALAKSARLPLVSLLGGAARPIPIYKTLVAMDPGKAAELALQAREQGYGGVKCKLGHPDRGNDLRLIQRIRAACGEDFPLMADYNQGLRVPEAMDRIHALDDLGLVWLEEPTEARDFAGHARIAQVARTPISIGENWRSPAEAAESLRAGASDYAMPDLVNIGGVLAWLKTAAHAQAHGVPVSCHSFPEVCAHLLPLIGTPHWLEHVDLLDDIFLRPVRPSAGCFSADPAPGLGVDWNEDVLARSAMA